MTSYRGSWWLPTAPGRRLSGELTYGEPPNLIVDGTLVETQLAVSESGEPIAISLDVASSHDVIHGEAVGVGPVTVVEAWGGNNGWPSFLVQQEDWHFEAVIEGGHLDPGATFDRVTVFTDYLADWTGRSGHAIESGPEGVKVTVPSSSVLLASSSTEMDLELMHLPSFDNKPFRVVLESRVAWEVRLKTPVGWRDVVETVVAPLQDLATFCTTRPNRVLKIILRQPQDSVLLQLNTPLARGNDLAPRDERTLPAHDQLFTLAGWEELMPSVVGEWFRLYSRLREVIGRLLVLQYRPGLYFDDRVSYVVGAAERLHTRLWNRTSQSPELHETRMNAALSPEKSDDREWAASILRQKNGLPLKTRLFELVGHAIVAGCPLKPPDRNAYVKTLADLRNPSAHGSSAAIDIHAFWNVEALVWLIRIVILGELGLSPEDVQRLFLRKPNFTHVAGQLGWTAAT